jgi:hypothetical protein
MAIKGNTVPDSALFVRAEHYESMQMLLTGVSWERQREHDLRVTMQGRAETAEAALKEAYDLLLFAQSEAGPIGPYVTSEEAKFSRQRWSDMDAFLRRFCGLSGGSPSRPDNLSPGSALSDGAEQP